MREMGSSHSTSKAVTPETGLGSYTNQRGTDPRLVITFMSQRCRTSVRIVK